MATFCYECVAERKVKKLAYLPGYWFDLAQILCGGYFGILSPILTKKIIRRHSNVKMT